MTATLTDIEKIVGLQLGIKNVQGDQRLREDLGAESLDVQAIVTLLEEKYETVVADDEMAQLETVADIHHLFGGKG